LALVFRERATSAASVAWVPAVWISCLLAVLYYVREQLEIGRLAGIIRHGLAADVATLLGATTIHLFPSETNPESTPTKATRLKYHREFLWVVFIIGPVLVTAWFMCDRVARIGLLVAFRTLYPWYAIVSVAAAIRTFMILWPYLNCGLANTRLQPAVPLNTERRS
jgi:hypothetical protein